MNDIRPAKIGSRLIGFAGFAIDTIKINEIACERRGTREFWVKRRRKASPILIHCANLFFRLAQNPVSVFGDLDKWQSWEIESFHLLNGDQFTAFVGESGSIWADKLPGIDLATRIKEGSLTLGMLQAAGRELARAHDLWSDMFNGKWSHSDPHLGNFVFDEEAGRARLIDFETIHNPGLASEARHADDLAVFLLDLLGRASDSEWPEMARAFVSGYGDHNVIRLLKEKFVMPFGFGRLWWAIRTSYVPGQVLRRRVDALQDALA